LLFAKNTVGWGDVMVGLPLPYRVVKTAEEWGCLLSEEKMII